MIYCPNCTSELISKIIDGEQRLACSDESCSYILWDNPVPVVAALVELDGNYIIARNAQWPEGMFSVIAGYLEKGETPEQAVMRECEEELGLSGVVVGYIGNYSFFEKNQLIIAYEIKASGNINLNHELAEVKLLSRTELQEYDFATLEISEKIISDWLKQF
ncbi:MAG: NUDIX domain-containing protein [Gammaproteobacteria bacterium]